MKSQNSTSRNCSIELIRRLRLQVIKQPILPFTSRTSSCSRRHLWQRPPHCRLGSGSKFAQRFAPPHDLIRFCPLLAQAPDFFEFIGFLYLLAEAGRKQPSSRVLQTDAAEYLLALYIGSFSPGIFHQVHLVKQIGERPKQHYMLPFTLYVRDYQYSRIAGNCNQWICCSLAYTYEFIFKKVRSES